MQIVCNCTNCSMQKKKTKNRTTQMVRYVHEISGVQLTSLPHMLHSVMSWTTAVSAASGDAVIITSTVACNLWAASTRPAYTTWGPLCCLGPPNPESILVSEMFQAQQTCFYYTGSSSCFLEKKRSQART